MTLKLDGTLLLAGAGNMGSAMLAGWLEQRARSQADHRAGPRAAAAGQRSCSPSMAVAAARQLSARCREPPAVIMAAVKPQVMDEVFPPLGKLAGKDTVVLSIAAGRTIAGFEKYLPKGTAVIRSMPNTPASIGRGITVAVANAHVTPAQRTACDGLLRAIGEVAWVDDEGLIDAVTAVSGSGPAYVFYLAECLAEAGVKAGLQPELAQKLARWTVSGAGELLHRSDLGAGHVARECDLARRHHVRGPAGADGPDGLAKLMTEAVAAATKRSRELAK